MIYNYIIKRVNVFLSSFSHVYIVLYVLIWMCTVGPGIIYYIAKQYNMFMACYNKTPLVGLSCAMKPSVKNWKQAVDIVDGEW